MPMMRKWIKEGIPVKNNKIKFNFCIKPSHGMRFESTVATPWKVEMMKRQLVHFTVDILGQLKQQSSLSHLLTFVQLAKQVAMTRVDIQINFQETAKWSINCQLCTICDLDPLLVPSWVITRWEGRSKCVHWWCPGKCPSRWSRVTTGWAHFGHKLTRTRWFVSVIRVNLAGGNLS